MRIKAAAHIAQFKLLDLIFFVCFTRSRCAGALFFSVGIIEKLLETTERLSRC